MTPEDAAEDGADDPSSSTCPTRSTPRTRPTVDEDAEARRPDRCPKRTSCSRRVEIELSPEEQAEIERRGRMKWFVIHANTGHENKVKRNIEMAIKSNHMEE